MSDSIIEKLKGGDLRSIGKTNEVVQGIQNQQDFDELFQGLYSEDRKVVMRAADGIEKVTSAKRDYLEGHQGELLALAGSAGQIELKWHLALLLARLSLTEKELNQVWRLLTGWVIDPEESKLVRVHALQALFDLSRRHQSLTGEFESLVRVVEQEGIPSLNARIRKIRNARRSK